MEHLGSYIASGIAVISALVSWLISDSASKARAEILLKNYDLLMARNGAMEINLAKSEQDRMEIHSSLLRLDDTKASKELLDASGKQMERFMLEMDRRFDKLEKLMQEIKKN